ncbi:MAG: substrate-binding domain-containing protein, partial [Anaerolineae bacterium]|nr:substrate-binding domain-containing protein [Anaerolineae bacterium]
MRRAWMSILILVALLATGCGGAAPTAAPTATPQPAEPAATEAPTQAATEEPAGGEQISIAGSTTVQPVAEKIGAAFTEMTGAKVDVAGGGSSSGVVAAGDGTADIGNASRDIKQSELETYPDLVIHTIAQDG